MTEKRRLETAAPAMRERMITRRSVRVLSVEPPRGRDADRTAMMVTGREERQWPERMQVGERSVLHRP